MAKRFTRASVVFRDIVDSVERSVNLFIRQLNIEVARLTPIRTGTARRGWRVIGEYKLRGNTRVIENRVPYIGLLEMGYSKQAPNGMLGPALTRLNRRKYKI